MEFKITHQERILTLEVEDDIVNDPDELVKVILSLLKSMVNSEENLIKALKKLIIENTSI